MKIEFTFPLYWQPETAALFMDFVQMRKAIRKPIATQRGFDALVRSVDKIAGIDQELAKKVIEQTLDHEWRGFFALIEDRNHKISKWDAIK